MHNVVLVTIDSLRSDVSQEAIPTFTKLADEGLEFETAVAPGPRTPSSIPPSMTGEFYRTEKSSMAGRRNGIRTHIVPNETIPERFAKRDYTTVGFSSNPWTASDTGFDSIFDEFYELNPNTDNDIDTLPKTPVVQTIDRFLKAIDREEFLGWQGKREWFTHWTSFQQQIFEKIDNLSEPYFVWIFLMDTHQPTIVPQSFRRETNLFKTYYSLYQFNSSRSSQLSDRVQKWLDEGYRDAARSADRFLKDIRNEISANDILVVHSDHGEARGEHGTNGHEYQLYEENIKVPMAAHHPDLSGSITDQFSLIDLPDLLDTLAVNPKIDPENWGRQFIASMSESDETARVRSEMINYTPHRRSLRGDRFKLIETPDDHLLFDLEADPNEKENVAESHPELVDAFLDILNARCAKREEQRKVIETVQEIY
ncbi:sulfatase-like hydrolase/transferase [Halomicrococcus sp. NG-SE-24]|uniref:sulfatase-like hydrolase/transferase n=1 Tax=Halomicrococcus sp. NG-SE-24 TaxID=3436928 RepID=UPI003D9546A7